MTYQKRNLNRLCRELTVRMEEEFSRVGIFFRIFDRVKSPTTVLAKKKIKGKNYYDGESKFIRDIIGIRIVLYFPDDIQIVHTRIKKLYEVIEETIDKANETNFEPIRLNVICKLPKDNIAEFRDLTKDSTLDSSFEIQLRTILSEGWHEVDHDLRYKCPEDWKHNTDLARNLNGILATLETSEYAILRLFDQLSYRHYKSQDIVAMIRTKFRLRLEYYELTEELSLIFTKNLLKEFYKIERTDAIKFLFEGNILIPITLENFIYLVNYKFIKNPDLIGLTPKVLLKDLQLIDEIVSANS